MISWLVYDVNFVIAAESSEVWNTSFIYSPFFKTTFYVYT